MAPAFYPPPRLLTSRGSPCPGIPPPAMLRPVDFQATSAVAHPAPLVLETMLERMDVIAPLLRNVERIETTERAPTDDGRLRIVRRWQGSANAAPRAVRPFLGPDVLAWLDTALWTPADYTALSKAGYENCVTLYACVNYICRAAAERRLPVMIPTRPMMNWRFKTVPIETIGDAASRHRQTTFVVSGPNYLIEYQSLV